MRYIPYVGAFLSGVVFLTLLFFMQIAPADFVRIDARVATLLHPFQTYSWVRIFEMVTVLGSTSGIIAIALLTAALLQKTSYRALQLLLILASESALVQMVKGYVARVRPEALPWIGQLHSFSFPSGHSASAMALFGFIAVVAHTRLTGYARLLSISTCILIIVGVGLSRIVLAAHYFSDVVAGFALGGLCLSLILLGTPLVRRRGRAA